MSPASPSHWSGASVSWYGLGSGCCAWRCSADRVRCKNLARTIQESFLTPSFFRPLLRQFHERAWIGNWLRCSAMIGKHGIDHPAENFSSCRHARH